MVGRAVGHCLFISFFAYLCSMNIRNANPYEARQIARLIMTAMSYDCCRYFTGPDHTLQEFEDMMTQLVAGDCRQYSFRNTLVAADAAGGVAGISVSYDGARLHCLRRAFTEVAREAFGRDFSAMDDETQPGELYIDSLAVRPEWRHRGVATALLQATIAKARRLQLPAVGLLVDQGNPAAEQLYRSVGFGYANDAAWGGHPMRHLVINLVNGKHI